MQIKVLEGLNILQIYHYEESVKINTNQSMKNFWLCLNWIALKNQSQSVQIKVLQGLNILQIDHYKESVKINSNQSMKIFLLCFN